MPDYRALAQALNPYAMDTGTPDAIKMFQSGYKLPNFLGMTASQPTPQEIERMAAEQSPAFGVFPQMKPYRSEQDITASANVPVDLLRGRVAGTRGLFGDVVNQPIPMVRPLQLLSQAFTGQQKYPDTEHYLDTMPLKSNTPIGDVAGRIGSFAPINPMPAVRAGQKGLNLLGMEVADRLATGRSVLPSLLKEPQTAMFAVEPNPSMAMADESSAMRQQLTDKMQALLAQKKMATSAVDVGSINQQIGELQAQFKSLPSMGRVAREVVVPEITAPVSNIGFYSATEQAAINLERSKGTGQSFLNDLMNAPDVKNYEIEAMGLDTYLKGKPNVTRQEVQDFIATNKLDVQERQLSGRGDKSGVFSEFNPDKNQFMVYGEDLSHTHAFNTAEEADNFVKQFNSQIPYGPSKYDKYQLPGGKNYREILLTLPKQSPTTNDIAGKLFGKEMRFLSEAEKDAVVAEARNIESTTPKDFRSSHFEEPNILAHMRLNDRVDAQGKKMLLIEEVQSDWHQAGREKGYNDPKAQAQAQEKIIELKEEHRILGQLKELTTNEAERNAISQKRFDLMNQAQELSKVGQSGVPDAPFKDTWHQLALKRAIKEAVDKGYDRIGLTTGAQQASRYNLSNEVDEINVIGRIDARTGEKSRQVALDLKSGGSYKLGVNNEGIIDNVNMLEINNLQGKNLADVVGKEVAKKIMESNSQTIKGEGLNIGGEGMKKYYDEVYPNYLDKLGKKYGARVGETKVNTGIDNLPAGSSVPTMKQEPVRYLDITPEMRKAIKEGQPLASIEEELAKALA